MFQKSLPLYFVLYDSASHHKAAQLAYPEVLKLWHQFFGAQSEDFPTRNTVLNHLGQISAKYIRYTRDRAGHEKNNYSKQLQFFHEIKSFLESPFTPFLTFIPKAKNVPSFKEWEQKQSRFELDLRFAVLKIPSYEDLLHGDKTFSSCIVAEKLETCPIVKRDNFCEAFMDSETASCASLGDSYTLTRECLKCGNHGNTHPLKDQSTQTIVQ